MLSGKTKRMDQVILVRFGWRRAPSTTAWLPHGAKETDLRPSSNLGMEVSRTQPTGLMAGGVHVPSMMHGGVSFGQYRRASVMDTRKVEGHAGPSELSEVTVLL